MQQLAPSPLRLARLTLRPYGLISLWQLMIKISLQQYVDLGETVREAKICLDAFDGLTEIDPVERGGDFTVFEALSDMQEFCTALGARQIGRLLKSRTDHKTNEEWARLRPKNWEELDTLVEAFKKELDERLFLYVPNEVAVYYQKNDLLSDVARVSFPNLTQELRAAENAYACDLSTAAMYHCMRALEYALGALATDVGLTWTKENWQVILDQIERNIRDLGSSLPRGPAKDLRLQQLSAAAKEFFYFKDGWRNYVAHNRITYDQTQAAEMIEHVRALTEHLASKMSLKEAP